MFIWINLFFLMVLNKLMSYALIRPLNLNIFDDFFTNAANQKGLMCVAATGSK